MDFGAKIIKIEPLVASNERIEIHREIRVLPPDSWYQLVGRVYFVEDFPDFRVDFLRAQMELDKK